MAKTLAVLSQFSGSGASYDADATAVFNAMATMPDATRKGHINTLVTALKSAGIWTKLDHLVVCANTAEADGLLDWKNPSTPWTAVNSPTFTSDQGYAGNGTSSYLVGPTNLSSLTQYQQNSGHIALWSRTATAAASTTAYDYGTTGASGSFLGVVRDSAGKATGRINHTTGTTSTSNGSVTDGSGFFVFTRTGSTEVRGYRNGTEITGSPMASTSTTRAAAPPSVGRHNTTYTARQWALIAIGSDVSAEQAAYHSAVSAYMTAVGAA